MKLSIQRIIAEAEGMMSGYSGFYSLQLSNISVVAEAEALLSVSVSVEEGDLDIEEVADIGIPNDDMFVMVPKIPSYLFPICKAVITSHPEYKIERKVYTDDADESKDFLSLLSDETDDADLEDMVICCTMPEMNDDRRDACMNLVKIFYDQAIVSIDEEHVHFKAELVSHLQGATPVEADEANDKLEEIYNQQKEQCGKSRKEKEDQIEKAYQKYLTKKEEEEQAAIEETQAKGDEAMKSMSFESMLNSEE